MKPGSVAAVISSPPFQESLQSGDTSSSFKNKYPDAQCGGDWGQSYGQTPGNLGNLKPGDVGCVISSPPYATGSIAKNSTGIDRRKQWETYRASGGGLSYEGFAAQQEKHSQEYGETEGQLQNLKPGDIGCVISSPPFEDSINDGADHDRMRKHYPGWGLNPDGSNRMAKSIGANYGSTEGQLGRDKGPSFWQAARDIVSECHKILRPGGHAIWVTKAFVRKGKRVDFPGDWQRLCEAVGFRTVCIHHAMVEKQDKNPVLFDMQGKIKGSKSFFRRLGERKAAWKKYWLTVPESEREEWTRQASEASRPGKRINPLKICFEASGQDERDWNDHVRIDWETIICMEKP